MITCQSALRVVLAALVVAALIVANVVGLATWGFYGPLIGILLFWLVDGKLPDISQ